MKTINVTGYFGTGSSAVIDYIREFKNVEYIDSEIHLFINNGGLDELNYKMKNYNTLLSGIAIYKYERLVNALSKVGIYGEPFDSKKLWDGYFLKRSLIFIKEISNGYTEKFIEYNKVEKKGNFNKWEMKILPKLKKQFFKYFLLKKNISLDDFICYKRKVYYPKSYNNYINKQERYVKDLLKHLNRENKEYLLLDHFIPVSILKSTTNCNIKLKNIVVDRDPRDIYLLNKLKWKEKFIPNDIYGYIEWYLASRQNKMYEESDHILCLNFEDLIYKYGITTEKINNFLKLEQKNHIYPMEKLNINISINNTQLFNKYTQYSDDIKIIEKRLSKYLYNFPKIDIKRTESIF